MHLIDLELSEVLGQNNSVYGGFGFSKNVVLDTAPDIDFENLDIDLDVPSDLDISASTNIRCEGIEFAFFGISSCNVDGVIRTEFYYLDPYPLNLEGPDVSLFVAD